MPDSGQKKTDNKLILKDFLPYRLSVLSSRISRSIANLYETRFALSLPEWRVMAVLGETSGLSAAEVGERTAMDKVAVSRAISRLLKAGRLKRVLASDDRRRSVLSLTAKGKAVYKEIVPLALEYEQKLLNRLSPEDISQLDIVLEHLKSAQSDIENTK